MQFCGLAIGFLATAAFCAENWQIVSRVNGGSRSTVPVIFVRMGDVISLEYKAGCDGQASFGSGDPLRWREIKPVLRAYDNTRGGLDAVEYRLGPALGTAAVLRVRLGAEEMGTHYYTVSGNAFKSGIPWTATGHFQTAEPLQRAFPGHIIQVVGRPDDSYLGHLKELLGTPFIMGPGVSASGFHQTDQRVGSDCAAFAIYGRRRLGVPVPYCGPSGIFRYLREIIPGRLTAGSDGVYHTSRGDVVRTGSDGLKPGDILHFGAQVSVFYEDRGVPGKLDAEDLLLESWGETPHVTSIRGCGFYQYPVRVLRWAK